MCQSKKSERKKVSVIASEAKQSPQINETASCLAVTIEYDSCYRGRIEIWKDRDGNVVYQKIIR